MSVQQIAGPKKAPTRDEMENRPYVHKPYPSVRYHPDGRTVIVQDKEADKALGNPWADLPYPAPEVPKAAADPTIEELKAQVAALMAELAAFKARAVEAEAEAEAGEPEAADGDKPAKKPRGKK